MVDTKKDFSARFNENYNFASSYSAEQLIKLGQMAEIFSRKVNGNKILDLGCGGASFIKFYVKRYRGPNFKDPVYLGVDVNKKYIAMNNEWLSNMGNGKFPRMAKFVHSDLETDFFWNKLAGVKADLVIAEEIIEHLTDRDLFLRRCHNVLADDGVIIISTPVHRSRDEGIFERNKIYHEFEYYWEDFYEAIGKYFLPCNSFGSLIDTMEFKKKLRQKYPGLYKFYNQLRSEMFIPPALLISVFKLYTSHLDREFENLTVVCKRKKIK